MKVISRLLVALAVIVALFVAFVWVLGKGWLVSPWDAGTPTGQAVPRPVLASLQERQHSAALSAGVTRPDQILFGDLHVHTTFSFDAFMMSLPITGGDGSHPVADACDFARFCSGLDFWSINDHALASTPERWRQTIDAIRQCDAVGGNPEAPDLVSFLGWEWTQVGTRPENHWGHKNVVLRDLDDAHIPTRPIDAVPPGAALARGSTPTFTLGLFALFNPLAGGMQFARYIQDLNATDICPEGVPVRELPSDCRERAATPEELFAKLDDWGFESIVIPHGTTWGFYTPLGSSWDKQLTAAQHDPERQGLIEVMSGHGNSEEYRPFREVVLAADGTRGCPEPTSDYLPSCWRAGEIIRERCLRAEESAEECEKRAVDARRNFVDADINGGAATVPAWTGDDWLDAGQCRDCFQPAFNYRPKSSVQYIMALARGQEPGGDPMRFRFGFIASSDNHSARPGTGYKEVARSEFTEARFGNFARTPLGRRPDETPEAYSRPFDPAAVGQAIFGVFESERQASFFLNGGLVAVHSPGRDRNTVFEALKQKRVYGTSGPRILLWFDLLNPRGLAERAEMGSINSLSEPPVFEVRAVGSFEQLPGCPDYSTSAMGPERIARICQGECYNPSDKRRLISRIEVVRIRPQSSAQEDVGQLIDDPWRVFPCQGNPAGCRVVFSDDEFRSSGRDAMYYVRAIEEPSLAVDANPLRCEFDAEGQCIKIHPCAAGSLEDDCLSRTEERAWSSPIFVDHAR